jgi:hypothetical protein
MARPQITTSQRYVHRARGLADSAAHKAPGNDTGIARDVCA